MSRSHASLGAKVLADFEPLLKALGTAQAHPLGLFRGSSMLMYLTINQNPNINQNLAHERFLRSSFVSAVHFEFGARKVNVGSAVSAGARPSLRRG